MQKNADETIRLSLQDGLIASSALIWPLNDLSQALASMCESHTRRAHLPFMGEGGLKAPGNT